MDVDDQDENITALMSMGFNDVKAIKRALKVCKNDMYDAVSYLSGCDPDEGNCSYRADVEMKTVNAGTNTSFSSNADESLEFPTTHLYELESRVFTDQWSIPFKKEESLGKCLTCAIRLAQEGLSEADENCKRFVDKTMPESFKKLLNTLVVQKWNYEIQEGIYDMVMLLMDYVSIRLKHGVVPIDLMNNLLTLVFDPSNEFNAKNRIRSSDTERWNKLFSTEGPFAISPPRSKLDLYPCGWLVDIINRFGEMGGFDQIKKRLEDESEEFPNHLQSIAALLKPLGVCASYLNPGRICDFLSPYLDKTVNYIINLKENDLKSKTAGSITDVIFAIKMLCIPLWPEQREMLDKLQLDVILRMLKCNHFNARMNALKEVTKLVNTTDNSAEAKYSIEHNQVLDWVAENEILSLALEGNIDQMQYCDKLKGLLEFLSSRLSTDELSKIWSMQKGRNVQVMDNLSTILTAASTKFNTVQFDHLFSLIQETWKEEDHRIREKLLTLIGKIGKESHEKTKVLDLLWNLAHLHNLPRHLLEHSFEEHMCILTGATTKDQRSFVIKCLEDIKKGLCVLPAIKHIHGISKAMVKPDLNKNHDIIKLLTTSLIKCHKQASSAASSLTPFGNRICSLTSASIVENNFSHGEYVQVHLDVLQYLLQDGHLYLSWNRAKDIWDTLVTNCDSCYYDKELCFEWFTNCIQDLESDTQSQLYQNKLLKMDPEVITEKGFSCFQTYFESVNLNDHKLHKSGNTLIVEKLDPAVNDFLWRVALEAQNDEIADLAMRKILEISFINLSPRLKKDPENLHSKFISECYKKLENFTIKLAAPTMSSVVSSATKTLTAISVTEAAQIPVESRSTSLRNLKRILLIAQKYIVSIEELHVGQRTMLPHGASFHGYPISLQILVDSNKEVFALLCHSNESVWSLRQRIAQELHLNVDLLQLSTPDCIIPSSKNQLLLSQLKLAKEVVITAKSSSGTTIKEERSLPGVVMSSGNFGTQLFETLYQIAEIDDPSVTERVKELLLLIPTDHSIIEILDAIVLKETSKLGGASAASMYESSPRSSPRFPKKSSSPNQTKDQQLSPRRDKLKSLFDLSLNEMGIFRLLYNLQVLSGKLMPTSNEIGLMENTGSYKDNFMKAGGLKVITKILNSDSVPIDCDENIRQSCYYIALQIVRYLLCGETVINFSDNLESDKPPPYIVSLSEDDFQDVISCFVRLIWAATAGKIYLANSSYPNKRSQYISYIWSSWTTNTYSNESDGDNPTLHGGLCVHQDPVSEMNSLIAEECLDLLFTCLKLRPELISLFYNIRCIGDFVIDVLLGSPNVEIRTRMRDLLYTFSQQKVCESFPPKCKNSKFLSPRQFVTQLILNAHLPLWVSSSRTRGTSQRLLSHCKEYFDLRCRLLKKLTAQDQVIFNIKLNEMISDEISWLNNFTTSSHVDLQESDCALLSGHLFLIRSLLTGEGINKSKIGRTLIPDIIENCLFPASKMIAEGGLDKSSSDQNSSLFSRYVPQDSRVSAYDVLYELARSNVDNITLVVSYLVEMHHRFSLDFSQEFEYEPAVFGHPESGHVGLKNAGATCYMNAIIQQLYMQPGVREAILAVDTDDASEENVIYQFQVVFGHLMDSKLQYHTPENFWKCFKLWGSPVNVREQQDAFEFYTHLVDQLDEYLRKANREMIFKHVYEGMFTDEKVCQECEHRYEREDSFMALNLTVKTNNLQDSLDQFVKGELLEGDNAYFCEKCSEKRRTIKRTWIKTLPPVLVVQLKRFGYDWEENRALKFDDHFKFPWTLDMHPYTTAGIQEKEKGVTSDTASQLSSPAKFSGSSASSLYELVGAVVHSGQANAGHYYSFIKERRGDLSNNIHKGKWYKFNDTTIEEIEMNESTLETECFGGSYKAKVSDYSPSPSYPETRVRYWNAYMLFYERRDDNIRTPITPRKLSSSRLSSRKSGSTPRKSSVRGRTDSLTQLTQLVHHGERQGLFLDKMPARIQRIIKTENLHFMRDRDVYNDDYISFIQDLAFSTVHNGVKEERMLVQALCLAVNFLFNTYLHMKKKEKNVVEKWLNTIDTILKESREASSWLMDYFASDDGSACSKLFLMECSSRDVRQKYVTILEKSFFYFFMHTKNQVAENVNKVFMKLLQLLESDVLDKNKNCAEYFSVLNSYCQLGLHACSHIFSLQGFRTMVTFLLGSDVFEVQDQVSNLPSRRWSSLRTQEFSALHSAIATLILNCNLKPHRTHEDESFSEPSFNSSEGISVKLKIPDDVYHILYGPMSSHFIREVVCACREVSGSITKLIQMLVSCSFCNENFTKNLLMQIVIMEDPMQFRRIQVIIGGDSIEGVFCTGMLTIIRKNHESDSRRSYQCVKFLVGLAHKTKQPASIMVYCAVGGKGSPHVISKRQTANSENYITILEKTVIPWANKRYSAMNWVLVQDNAHAMCPMAKEYLLQNPSRWQWAVTWLKKKMTEHTTALWSSSNNPTILSNEDSNTKNFQRTISAQDTLAEATAMLTELESPDGKIDMEIDCDSSEVFASTNNQQLLIDDDFLDSIDS
ncbi:Ubiquitin carboxyl-terminal hydrolase 24 [Nymphon striatum]|nr:Ubiquitin carboxyl-terminal hydrolase 24 [Nymphon striatum]